MMRSTTLLRSVYKLAMNLKEILEESGAHTTLAAFHSNTVEHIVYRRTRFVQETAFFFGMLFCTRPAVAFVAAPIQIVPAHGNFPKILLSNPGLLFQPINTSRGAWHLPMHFIQHEAGRAKTSCMAEIAAAKTFFTQAIKYTETEQARPATHR